MSSKILNYCLETYGVETYEELQEILELCEDYDAEFDDSEPESVDWGTDETCNDNQ
jgi:hypothetical protein